jgi:type II secretory pathway component PulF
VKVLPSFEQIFMGMGEGRELPAFTRLVFATNGIFTAIQAAVFAFLLIAFFFYVGGPRLREWEDSWWPNRRLIFPWTWKRRQRDFSAMLVILLDAGVPENEAVRMAGESTASPALRHGAELVSARLNQGEKLPDALSAMDKSGELAWRISNALRRGKGFLRALKGWHEALDARAFQLEQTAAQITTSSLVLLNGLIVGAIACAIFLALINLLNQAALW